MLVTGEKLLIGLGFPLTICDQDFGCFCKPQQDSGSSSHRRLPASGNGLLSWFMETPFVCIWQGCCFTTQEAGPASRGRGAAKPGA